MAQLDFSSVPKREPLAEGVYLVEIEHAEEKDTSTGKRMIVVRFKEPESGTAVFLNCVLDPSCLFRLQELLNAIGVDADGMMDSEEIVALLPGNQVKIKVTQRTYNDQVTNDVKKIMAA